MNFGESIAYWYLRLNGFFPISNYVLHRTEDELDYSADADILAIRFPYVYEPIGGQATDWDLDTFKNWDIHLQESLIGVIVEAKTGKDKTEVVAGAHRAFSSERIMYGLRRLGIWHPDHITAVANELGKAGMYRDPKSGEVVGKLLISDNVPEAHLLPPCLVLSLEQADEFIVRRIDAYINQKNSDRRFFPSELIQYIIWERAHNH